jgi:H+/Cl- antiporter ClcA
MPRVFGPGRLILATVIIGVLAGLGATGFHFVADRFGESLFAWVESQTAASRLPFVLQVPAIGLGIVGLALQYYQPARLGGGREVFESIEHDGGIVPMHRIWNVVLSALVGSAVGQRSGLFGTSLQTVVRAGSAAGVAALFRSPAGRVLLLPGIIAGGISFLLSWKLHDESVFGRPCTLRPDAAVAAAR